MKIYVFFIICCAATIFAAPANEEGEAGIHVEVKPVDLQIKIPPSNIEVTVSKEKQSSTSTTTKLPTEKPEEEDKIEEPPNSPNDKVKTDESTREQNKPSVILIIKPAVKKSTESVEAPKTRRHAPARGRVRFRSENIDSLEASNYDESNKNRYEKIERAKLTSVKPKSRLTKAPKPNASMKTIEPQDVNEEKPKVKKNEFRRNKLKTTSKATTTTTTTTSPAPTEEGEDEEKLTTMNVIKPKYAQIKTPALLRTPEEDKKEEKSAVKKAELSPKNSKTTTLPPPKEAEKVDETDKSEPAENKVQGGKKSTIKPTTKTYEQKRGEKENENEGQNGKKLKTKNRSGIPSAEERRKGRKYHDIKIVQLESEIDEDGKYRYNYEGEDGTYVEQEGKLKKKNDEDMGESVKGSYSYKDDEGKTFSVTYTADENGYRPMGAHIPTIPPAIARALAWAATAKPWVDPWLVQQEKLKGSRNDRKLVKNGEKKTTKPIRVKQKDGLSKF